MTNLGSELLISGLFEMFLPYHRCVQSVYGAMSENVKCHVNQYTHLPQQQKAKQAMSLEYVNGQ